jgi:N-acetylated-alpha-linked acidic dipeptidase
MKRKARSTSSVATALFALAAAGSLLLLVGPQITAGQDAPAKPIAILRGYSAAGSRAELDLEKRFAAIPSPDRAREWHRTFTAEPHPAGSPRNNELARYIADEWKKQGWDEVTLREYDVWHSGPKSASLEMTAPVHYNAGLHEDVYDVDPDTKNPAIPQAYMGFSASGEVTAPVVYARGGNPEDYEFLKKNGIDPRGKIALVRYSNPYSYRGFKALTAQRMGVAALIIYSDPAEDGYAKGKTFPDGPWGPESHIQHGAITYDFMVPGDPQTPGWASVPGAKRIPIEEAISVPKIICLPISWRDAKPLLENMNGPEAPKDWQGALPIKYRLGGAVEAHLKVEMDDGVKPYYVVDARMIGAELPDEWVVMGNHRDAWVFGGVDPSSGTATMMEMTRALGEMRKTGWRPKRTLIICSWDGEEYGLTGSTEWGEQFADELRKKGVAYLNVDSSTSGPNLNVTGVPSLAPLLVEVSRAVEDSPGTSLYDSWKKSASERRKSPPADTDLVNVEIGSGSDHTVFLNFDGVSSVGLGFSGPYGVYHSAYDSFYWMNHFGDPRYHYHTLMSRYWGQVALRLSQADVLPFDFGAYGAALRGFVEQLDHRTGLQAHVDLAPLLASIKQMESAGRYLTEGTDAGLAVGRISKQAAAALNRDSIAFERTWLDPAGIPGRPWFKHLIYACRYTYAHLELPRLAEPAEAGNWAQASAQAARIRQAVEANTALLSQAGATLKKSTAATSLPGKPSAGGN